MKSGRYLWNAGMFIFNINYLLNVMKDNLNTSYELLNNLPSINSEEYMKKLKEEYPKCESISIDYAVMEKSKDIYVIPGDFGWDDVGTWNALERYIEKDENLNVSKGNVEFCNTNNCVVYGENKRIIFLDLDNVFFAEGEDTIIVSKKDSMNKVKNFRK